MKNSKIVKGLKKRNSALTITVGNEKGGVGKTTNATIIGYILATKYNLKTLVVDLDPQSNATKMLMLTKSDNQPKHVNTISETIMRGIQDGNLSNLPTKIVKNLYLLPSFIDFQDFTKYLYRHTSNDYEETHFLAPLFNPIKKHFNIILIDVPPMNKEITENAVIMSDYILISLQTQEGSLTGAENYINQLLKLKEKYNLPVDVIGILRVLHQNRGSVDKFIMKSVAKEYGKGAIFNTIVPNMERIKRFPINGITENDYFDKQVIKKYKTVTDELLKRINYYGF